MFFSSSPLLFALPEDSASFPDAAWASPATDLRGEGGEVVLGEGFLHG